MDKRVWNEKMRKMFRGIAHRYDIMNTIMSFGLDQAWRRRVIDLAAPRMNGLVLDVGAGTGKISRMFASRSDGVRVVAADLTPEMMKIGMRNAPGTVLWCCADAHVLPFRDCSFDAVVSGFLVRNVPDIRAAFAEQFRVVKPGGRVVCLDAGPVPDTLLKPLVLIYLNVIIPRIGGLVSGDRDAYRYLPDSTQVFKTSHELGVLMSAAGFTCLNVERHMLGTMNIVRGERPL